MVFTKTYDALPFCKKEILRYAGCKADGALSTDILDECISEAENEFVYKVCYTVLDVKLRGNNCDFGAFSANSENLAGNLKECCSAVVFAATVGVGIDRLIMKYSTVSPSKALLLQAIGAERIEGLCDMFYEDIKSELKSDAMPRFSPGYGDLDLSCQKDIFSVLNCEKHIGLTLTDSMLMSPSKSVTAVIGLCNTASYNKNKCDMCENKNCSYRGDL